MQADRPPSGEELNPGAPTVPRLAATVVVLRGGTQALEVLLVKRNPAARFMGGAWVFPGGAVDPGDGDGDDALRAAALREMAEEAGLVLDDPASLVRFSRWITPPELRIRFDPHFFLAPAPAGQEARADGGETVDARWFHPARALEGFGDGEIELVFPTVRTLEQIASFASADALLAWARDRDVVATEPRIVREGEVARVALPGEPGYDVGRSRP